MNENTCLERILRLAWEVGQKLFTPYSHSRSPHRFTQPQLFVCLIFKHVRRRTYREAVEDLRLSQEVRTLIGLTRVPTYSTLAKFAQRAVSQSVIDQALTWIVQKVQPKTDLAAMDSSGLGLSGASAYFRMRQGKGGMWRRFVKVAALVLQGSLLPCGLVVGTGPGSDRADVPELVRQAQGRQIRPRRVFADAGFDSEKVHRLCWEDWKVPTYMPLNRLCKDGTARGKYRSLMVKLPEDFGQRWLVETYFSGLKRTTGHAVRARKTPQQTTEARLKVLTYAFRR